MVGIKRVEYDLFTRSKFGYVWFAVDFTIHFNSLILPVLWHPVKAPDLHQNVLVSK